MQLTDARSTLASPVRAPGPVWDGPTVGIKLWTGVQCSAAELDPIIECTGTLGSRICGSEFAALRPEMAWSRMALLGAGRLVSARIGGPVGLNRQGVSDDRAMALSAPRSKPF